MTEAPGAGGRPLPAGSRGIGEQDARAAARNLLCRCSITLGTATQAAAPPLAQRVEGVEDLVEHRGVDAAEALARGRVLEPASA
ncbi:hypothetical protein [Streptomyces sp. NPDC017988]|uniref:hypothetical protein n=1 Tax=Streptomyces sp. NPDC017988 TaxID=3365025 RepID=UPI00378D1155